VESFFDRCRGGGGGVGLAAGAAAQPVAGVTLRSDVV
jgi:hypothetical protein